MADYIIVDGDTVLFMPAFGAAIVDVQAGKMTASGPMTLTNKKLCVEGDEGKVSVVGCTYMAPPYVVKGVGTLKIAQLAGNQVAKKTKNKGKAFILKGSNFTAKFEVQTPAQMPPPASTPDGERQYSGNGSFITTNSKFRGL